MRTQKTDNSGTTYYYYDSDKNLIGLTKGNSTLLFYYDSDNSPVSMSYNGTMYYYVKNLQGDIVKIINKNGTVYGTYTYDAWGNVKKPYGDPFVSELNPIRYRGYVYDTDTGLYYLQSRYYDPQTGRFLNADVLFDTQSGTPLSTNMFAYCENNPANKIDPNGFISISIEANWLIKALFGAIMTLKLSGAALVTKVSAMILAIAPYLFWIVVAVATVIITYFIAKNVSIAIIKSKIPNKIKTKDGKVDLKKFSNKNGPKMPKGGRGILGPLGWYIVKDIDKHKGSVWKLFDWAGRRIASLLSDGTIIGK